MCEAGGIANATIYERLDVTTLAQNVAENGTF